jgi:hypothetical protein
LALVVEDEEGVGCCCCCCWISDRADPVEEADPVFVVPPIIIRLRWLDSLPSVCG